MLLSSACRLSPFSSILSVYVPVLSLFQIRIASFLLFTGMSSRDQLCCSHSEGCSQPAEEEEEEKMEVEEQEREEKVEEEVEERQKFNV